MRVYIFYCTKWLMHCTYKCIIKVGTYICYAVRRVSWNFLLMEAGRGRSTNLNLFTDGEPLFTSCIGIFICTVKNITYYVENWCSKLKTAMYRYSWKNDSKWKRSGRSVYISKGSRSVDIVVELNLNAELLQ